MTLSTNHFFVIASLLTHVPKVVIVIFGAVIILLGILRFFRLLPRLSLNAFRRPDNPTLEGGLTILIGVIVLVLAIVR